MHDIKRVSRNGTETRLWKVLIICHCVRLYKFCRILITAKTSKMLDRWKTRGNYPINDFKTVYMFLKDRNGMAGCVNPDLHLRVCCPSWQDWSITNQKSCKLCVVHPAHKDCSQSNLVKPTFAVSQINKRWYPWWYLEKTWTFVYAKDLYRTSVFCTKNMNFVQTIEID